MNQTKSDSTRSNQIKMSTSNQDITRCKGHSISNRNYGESCNRYASRKYNGYCNSHSDQAGMPVDPEVSNLIKQVASLEARNLELGDRNMKLEEELGCTEREVELTAELRNEKIRTEELEDQLQQAMDMIAQLKMNAEKHRLLEASRD